MPKYMTDSITTLRLQPRYPARCAVGNDHAMEGAYCTTVTSR